MSELGQYVMSTKRHVANMTVRVFPGGFGSIRADWLIQFHNPTDRPRMEQLRDLLKGYEAALANARRASVLRNIAQFVACQSESHRLEAAIDGCAGCSSRCEPN